MSRSLRKELDARREELTAELGTLQKRLGALGDVQDKLDQLAKKAFLVHQPHGDGHVVAFAEDPTTRGMVEGTDLLLLNAVLLGAAFAVLAVRGALEGWWLAAACGYAASAVGVALAIGLFNAGVA